ncbi:MAG: CopG family transcriptional regulator [Nitrospiraceae bacterium]
MRTTINLPDELLTQIKKLAAISHSTVTALIEDALREALARRRTRRHERVTLKTYGKQGLLPGVDIDDTASVLDVMESSVGPARR